MLHATLLEVYIQSPLHRKPVIYICRYIIYLKEVQFLFHGQMMTVPDVKINIKTGSILVLSVGRMPCAIINFFQAILAPWRFTSCRQWSVLRLNIYIYVLWRVLIHMYVHRSILYHLVYLNTDTLFVLVTTITDIQFTWRYTTNTDIVALTCTYEW